MISINDTLRIPKERSVIYGYVIEIIDDEKVKCSFFRPGHAGRREGIYNKSDLIKIDLRSILNNKPENY